MQNITSEITSAEHHNKATQAVNTTNSSPAATSEQLPEYLDDVYNWAYVNERNVEWLDRNVVFNVLLFGNGSRLKRAYIDHIQPGMRVWQVAHVYGDLVNNAAEKVGSNGQFDITDIATIQINHTKRKIGHLPQVAIHHIDAAQWPGKNYDLTCSFFLLHEVPDNKKTEILNQMLRSIEPNGQLVFVDYHRPALWNPVGWLLRWVTAKLEPFAEALWHKEIKDFADPALADQFVWHKRTFFGGVYQAVYAEYKKS